MNRPVQASRSYPQPCSPDQPCADIPRRSLGMFQLLPSWTENGVAPCQVPPWRRTCHVGGLSEQIREGADEAHGTGNNAHRK